VAFVSNDRWQPWRSAKISYTINVHPMAVLCAYTNIAERPVPDDFLVVLAPFPDWALLSLSLVSVKKCSTKKTARAQLTAASVYEYMYVPKYM